MRPIRHQPGRLCGYALCVLVGAIAVSIGADRHDRTVATPTAAEASYSLYARGHAGHFTAWVQYTLSPDLLHRRLPARLHTFLVDSDQPREFRWSIADYHGSQLDIGHLCEAAAARSDEAMREGFLLTNTMPQDAGLNRGQWRRLEEYLHARAHAGETITVCCGPAFLPDENGSITIRTIGEDQIWVPTHCWKAALCARADESVPHEALAWLVPNRDVGDFWKHKTSVDKLEAAVGFDLFRGLDEALE